MELLTQSRMKTARACKRLHHYEYNLLFRPLVSAEEARFGTLWHKGLEAWWLDILRQQDAGRADPARKDHAFPLAGDELDHEAMLDAALASVRELAADAFDLARVDVLLMGYHLRWKSALYEVLGVETEFESPLINPATGAASRTWRLAGKLDVVVRDLDDGLVKLVEHKSSSEDITPGSEYWRRLRMDSQISVYFDGAAALGHEVASCVYDVMGKPAQRPGNVPLVDEDGVRIVVDGQGNRVRTKDGKKWRQTASTEDGFVLQTRPETPDEFRARLADVVSGAPERFFARGEVVRLEAELDEARFDTWQTAKEIHEGRVAQRFPRNPDACVRFGRTCAFFDVCTGAADLTDHTRFQQLEAAHPELAGAAVQSHQ